MYYPIPSLEGKYEINEKGVVRNSKTKHVLNPVRENQFLFSINNKQVSRTRYSLKAEAVEKEGTYLPIPSLENKYEVNGRGIVRNATTKKPLHTYKYNGTAPFVSVKFKGKYSHRYIQQLMWEVHGVLPSRVCFLLPVATTIQKGVERYSFESMKKCAKFLAAKERWSFSWTQKQLSKRMEFIYGWKVFYEKKEQADISRPSQFIKRRKFKNEK